MSLDYASSRRLQALTGVLALFGILAIVIAGLAIFAAFVWPSGVAPNTRLVVGRIDDFAVDEPVYFPQHQLFVVRRPDDAFLALYAVSAHDVPGECPVEWLTDNIPTHWASLGYSGVFRAPCHGETFDITGQRLFGPSPRDLDRFPVVIDGDSVIVETGRQQLIKGSDGHWPHASVGASTFSVRGSEPIVRGRQWRTAVRSYCVSGCEGRAAR